MLATIALFLLSGSFMVALGTPHVQGNFTITSGLPRDAEEHIQQDKMFVDRNTSTTGRPRNCQDLIEQGTLYEGHYVVYPESSAPNIVSMVYCSQNEGMEPLPSDMPDRESARNCLDLLQNGQTSSGPNVIYPYLEHPTDPVIVFCDQETDGGGWAVIQNRYDGSVDFYRSWNEYITGFGNVAEEHYLGNDIIAALTGQSINELRVDLEAWDGEQAYAHYQSFYVDPTFDYRMIISFYEGSAGDCLRFEVGHLFSTFDYDYDDENNCAEDDYGAWWYGGFPGSCGFCNLNGRYLPSASSDSGDLGMFWYTFREWDSMKSTRMMVRPYACPATNTGGLRDPRETGAN